MPKQQAVISLVSHLGDAMLGLLFHLLCYDMVCAARGSWMNGHEVYGFVSALYMY